MSYDEKDWAMLGSISADTTHIALRVSLAIGTADREHRGHRSDDSGDHYSVVLHHHSGRPRAGLHAGAAHLYGAGFQRVALLRVNERYGRFGVRQVPGRFAAAGASGGARTEVYAGRYGFPSSAQRDSGVERGCHRALGRPGSRRQHPETDARDGHEAARFRRLSACTARRCCASPDRPPKGWSSCFPTIRRATIQCGPASGALSKAL